MIGDILLNIKKFLKQHIHCIHKYEPDRIGLVTGLNNKRICSKCEKFKRI